METARRCEHQAVSQAGLFSQQLYQLFNEISPLRPQAADLPG
jgi:hypothetical protein